MIQSRAWWLIQKFGSLRIKHPADINVGSRNKMEFVCECGKNKFIVVRDVTSGKTVRCGKCNQMSREWWMSHKFGNLKLKNPQDLNTGSHQKLVWICDCGKEKSIVVKDVTSGKTTSCNKCNEMPPEWWAVQKFGRLKLERPRFLHKGSGEKAKFTCVCGHTGFHSVHSVTSGKATSCGKCTVSIRNWFEKNRTTLQSLKTPISANSFPKGGPTTLETIIKVDQPIRAVCPHCKSVYRPRFSSLKKGKSLTCGCSAGMISGPTVEIYRFIKSKGFNAELEYKMSGYRYDIHIKDCKVLIEFQGERFHSSEKNQARDKKKSSLAKVYGYELIPIIEKMWYKEKESIKTYIIQVLENRKGIGYSHKCKNEILAKIEELDELMELNVSSDVASHINTRKKHLVEEMKSANEDIMSAAISSHHVMCAVKNMRPDEAFGNDPFIYYGLGLVGEAGELTGALLRAIRNGGSYDDKRVAVESELADCFIYATILAYATGIDLIKIVNEKARIVESRARAGYYGGPLHK